MKKLLRQVLIRESDNNPIRLLTMELEHEAKVLTHEELLKTFGIKIIKDVLFHWNCLCDNMNLSWTTESLKVETSTNIFNNKSCFIYTDLLT